MTFYSSLGKLSFTQLIWGGTLEGLQTLVDFHKSGLAVLYFIFCKCFTVRYICTLALAYYIKSTCCRSSPFVVFGV